MIRRIADNDIEFHVEYLLRFFGMDKFIGVSFQFLAPVVILLACAAKHAMTIFPSMFYALETDIALGFVESFADGILPVGRFGAIHRTAGKQGSQFRDGQPEKLILEDVVESLLPVGDLLLQPRVEALGDLPQKHAGLAAGIEESSILVAPDPLGEHIQYLVRQLRRREHLVTAQIRNAG